MEDVAVYELLTDSTQIIYSIANTATEFRKHMKGEFYIPRRIGYPQDQHHSLNHLQFFEIKKSLTQKSYFDFLFRNSTYIWVVMKKYRYIKS